MILVIDVKVIKDLRYVKVYVSIFCIDEEEKKNNFVVLKSVSGFIRKIVG